MHGAHTGPHPCTAQKQNHSGQIDYLRYFWVETIKSKVMISSLSQLDLNKRYSYAEYLTWQFEDRLELIDGEIFKMMETPSRKHQRVSGELSFQIWNFIKGKECETYAAPFDVRFPKSQGDENTFTVVQPDICIICDKKNCTTHTYMREAMEK